MSEELEWELFDIFESGIFAFPIYDHKSARRIVRYLLMRGILVEEIADAIEDSTGDLHVWLNRGGKFQVGEWVIAWMNDVRDEYRKEKREQHRLGNFGWDDDIIIRALTGVGSDDDDDDDDGDDDDDNDLGRRETLAAAMRRDYERRSNSRLTDLESISSHTATSVGAEMTLDNVDPDENIRSRGQGHGGEEGEEIPWQGDDDCRVNPAEGRSPKGGGRGDRGDRALSLGTTRHLADVTRMTTNAAIERNGPVAGKGKTGLRPRDLDLSRREFLHSASTEGLYEPPDSGHFSDLYNCIPPDSMLEALNAENLNAMDQSPSPPSTPSSSPPPPPPDTSPPRTPPLSSARLPFPSPPPPPHSLQPLQPLQPPPGSLRRRLLKFCPYHMDPSKPPSHLSPCACTVPHYTLQSHGNRNSGCYGGGDSNGCDSNGGDSNGGDSNGGSVSGSVDDSASGCGNCNNNGGGSEEDDNSGLHGNEAACDDCGNHTNGDVADDAYDDDDKENGGMHHHHQQQQQQHYCDIYLDDMNDVDLDLDLNVTRSSMTSRAMEFNFETLDREGPGYIFIMTDSIQNCLPWSTDHRYKIASSRQPERCLMEFRTRNIDIDLIWQVKVKSHLKAAGEVQDTLQKYNLHSNWFKCSLSIIMDAVSKVVKRYK